MAARSSDAAGPSAFEIRLGINVGRSSPENDPETIMVNAETTVNWIFIQGAYVLSHIHGRDRDGLQKDFDLYLVRPGRDDIVLNQSRVIADYNISRNDMLQLRHKSLPIPICVNLCLGDDRKVEVNSGFPLMDIIPVICKELGVVNSKELSIALPSSGPGRDTMQYEWLDRLSSLNGQGVQQGDTLLLRKKFFILNEDIQEALDGNEVLMELLYQQTLDTFTKENYVGYGSDSISSCSKLSALFHHIEQRDDNISDEDSVWKVMPRHFQNNPEYYSQTVANYYGERVGTLQVMDAKHILIKYFSDSQSIIVNYFPVKQSDSSGGQEEFILCVDSDRINVCRRTGTQDQLKVAEGMSWRLRDLRDAECTSQKDQHLRVNILGSWYEFLTDHSIQISRYLMEAQALTKLRVAKGRMSSANMRNLDIVGEILNRQRPSSGVLSPEDTIPEEDGDPKTPSLDPVVLVAPSSQSEEGEQVAAASTVAEKDLVVGAGVPDQPSHSEAQFDLDDINEAINHLSETNSSNASPSKVSIHFSVPPPPPSLATTPHHTTPPKEMEALAGDASPAKKSLSGASSTYVHIPEFLGLDFREVLEDYKLFNVVVMKQDVRTVLLHINKPVQEVVDSLCATFNIPNPSGCYLWIPTGIQTIIEKYGGKPKRRAGKFVKTHQNGIDFAPRLDVSKTLKVQYNFTIKPFLLHLRRYQAVEGVDAAEEVDCGTEWPEGENPDVAMYRKFYQSWTGIVQGAFPIERHGAVKLAGMLTQVYFGDWASSWPPRDYDPRVFLAEKHKNSFGISSEVEKVHRELVGKKAKDCINDVVAGCQQLSTLEGVFFAVSVPVKRDIFSLIPWNKMEQTWFGINQNGIFSIKENTGEILFTRTLSALSKWSATENSFKLTFGDSEFNAYTYQTREIVDTLELFVQMVVRQRGVQLGGQEEEKPVQMASTIVLSPTEHGFFNGDTPLKPLNLEIDRKQTLISPTTYNL